MFNLLPRSWRRSILSLMTVGCFLYGADAAWAANFDVANDFQLRTAIQNAASGDTITFLSNVTLIGDLPSVNTTVSFIGNGYTLHADDNQAFRINSGTVSISDLTIDNARTVGNDGDTVNTSRGGEGGDAGLGGAIFVGSAANVTITNVSLTNNNATGGDGSAGGATTISTGAAGTAGTFGNGGTGGFNGDPNTNPVTAGGAGGTGGFGAGGGGGGGGGGVGGTGGAGGQGGLGQFGGGAGEAGTATTPGDGGGGAGLGGAIFVQTGGTLTFGGTLTVNGNTVTGGSAGGAGAQAGSAFGSGLFFQAGTSAVFNPGTGQTMTFSDNISDLAGEVFAGVGSGSVVKNGEGTLILLGTGNSYTGGTFVNAGILQGNSASLQGNIFNDATVVFNQTVNGTFFGRITESGVVIKQGAGILTYGITQDNRGGTFVNEGTLRAGNIDVFPGFQDIFIALGATLDVNDFDQSIGGLDGEGSVTLGSNAATILTVNPESTSTFSGIISGSGALLLNGTGGTGTQILLGNNNYTGGTTVAGGTLQGNTTSLQGTIVNNATVRFDQALDDTYNGSISGTGLVEKTGAGLLIFNMAQTYTGGTIVNAGTLQIDGNNILATTGNLTVNDGTFDLDGNNQTILGLLGTGGTVDLGTGTLTVTPTGTATSAASITGAGMFIMNGTGTQILTGMNDYTGGTQVLTGILQGDTNGLQGPIAVSLNASLVFDQTFEGTHSGIISGDGSVTKQNTGRVILTGANNYTGGTIVTAGMLQGDTTSLQGNIDNSAALEFNQTTPGTFNGTISGNGTVTKLGASQLIFDTPQNHTGMTIVDAGLLTNNTTLAGPVQVNQLGRLGGNGAMGSTTVDGTIAPGNSIGTLVVNGIYTQNPGSTYEVEINAAGQSDLIQVNGNAVINGGTVEVVPLGPDNVRRGHTYTILTATGGVSGQYDAAINGVSGYVTPTLIYNPFDIQMTVRSNFLGILGGTENQQAVEGYFDNLNTTPGTDLDNIFGILDTLSPDQARAAFDQISGAQNASLLALDRMRNLYLIDQVSDQLRASLHDGLVGYSDESTGSWFKGYGIVGDLDTDSNAPGIDYDFSGFLAGVEARPDNRTRLGILGGYTRTSAEFNRVAGDAQGDSIVAGVYASRKFGPIHFLTAANYGYTDYTTRRSIIFPGVNRVATGDPDVHDANIYLETGYTFQLGVLEVQPLFGLQYMYVNQASFTETGADSLNLYSPGAETKSLFAMVGGRLSTLPIQSGAWTYKPYVHGKWIHDALNDDGLFTTNLAGAGGAFPIRGAVTGEDFVVGGTGVNLQRGNFSLLFDYTVLANSKQVGHSGSGAVQFVW